jgi:hypothetical protein
MKGMDAMLLSVVGNAITVTDLYSNSKSTAPSADSSSQDLTLIAYKVNHMI